MYGVLHRAKQGTERFVRLSISSIVAYTTLPVWTNINALFILSTGRTGTKTLARLLDLSDEIKAYHEPHPQLLRERREARTEVHAARRTYRHIFTQARGQALFKAYRRGKIYAETSARLTFFAPVIAEMMPNAKFLFIHRDPTELVRSGMRRGWYVDHPADYARVEPVEGEAFFERWSHADQFSKICWYWDAYNRFALDFCERIDDSRILTINANHLFDGSAVPDIFSLVSAPCPPSDDIDQILKKKLNSQDHSHFPKAENWSSDMFETLHGIAGGTMNRLGYPPTTRAAITRKRPANRNGCVRADDPAIKQDPDD